MSDIDILVSELLESRDFHSRFERYWRSYQKRYFRTMIRFPKPPFMFIDRSM